MARLPLPPFLSSPLTRSPAAGPNSPQKQASPQTKVAASQGFHAGSPESVIGFNQSREAAIQLDQVFLGRDGEAVSSQSAPIRLESHARSDLRVGRGLNADEVISGRNDPRSVVLGKMKQQANQIMTSSNSEHAAPIDGSLARAGAVPQRISPNQPSVARPQLRLVEDLARFEEEFEVDASAPVHSLHDLDIEPYRMQPRLARALVERFSNKGDIVFDPCGRFGTAALEASLLGREGRCAERHPVLASIAGAKVTPSDIAEVALMCQTLAMRRPVALDAYRTYFADHFDVETYRELVMLRSILSDSHARVDNVVRAIALSLLHGPSAGYLSVAAPIAIALSQDEQRAFNMKRGQRPDYRALLPRLLKRAATLTRDGLPSFAARSRRKTVGTLLCDPRKLDLVESSSVDLVLTEPPLPDSAHPSPGDGSWLRNWFVGSDTRTLMNLDAWSDWMNQCLLEWARVLKPGKRLVLVLGSFFPAGEQPEALVEAQIREALGRFFSVEGLLIEKKRTNAVRGSAREDGLSAARVLVLKRR